MKELRLSEKRISVCSENILIFAFVLFVVISILKTSRIEFAAWQIINRIAICISFLLVFVAFLFERHSIKEWSLSLALLIISCLSAYYSGEALGVLSFSAFIIAGSIVTSDKVFRAYFYAVIISALIVLLLYGVGFLPHEYMNDEGRFRMLLGFGYPTFLPKYFFSVTMTYLVLKRKEISVYDTIIIMVINIVLKQLTDTRAVFYCIVLFLAMCWLLRIMPYLFRTNLFKYFIMLWMPFMMVFSISLPLIYRKSNDLMYNLNAILSGRLALGHDAIEKYGLSLFGKEIKWSTGQYGITRFEEYFYVDSLYLNIALVYGIIVMLLFVVSFTMLGVKAYNENNYMICIVVIIIALFSFSDPEFFGVKNNPFLILIGMSILSNKELLFKYSFRDSKVLT